MSKEKDRMGTSLERLVGDLFKRIGFNVNLNLILDKSDGSRAEQDVLAEKANLKILIQCKDYAKFPDIKMEETIKKLMEDGESMNIDKLVLVIIGLKDITKWENYAEENGVYLWDEKFWRELQKIETNQELKYEIGRNLELPEFFVSERQILQLINSAKISDEDRQKLKEEISIFKNLDEVKEEIKGFEIRDNIKSNLETKELEEMERLMTYYNLDYHHKYLVYKKIMGEINLSDDPKRILTFQEIKTYIDKIAEEVYGKDEGSKHLIKIYELWRNGIISKSDRDKLSEKIFVKLGIHRKSEIGSGIIEIEKEESDAILKKKIIKTLIVIISWSIITFILWRILF